LQEYTISTGIDQQQYKSSLMLTVLVSWKIAY